MPLAGRIPSRADHFHNVARPVNRNGSIVAKVTRDRLMTDCAQLTLDMASSATRVMLPPLGNAIPHGRSCNPMPEESAELRPTQLYHATLRKEEVAVQAGYEANGGAVNNAWAG